MSEEYEIIANSSAIGRESDGPEIIGFAFNEGMLSAVEVRQMQVADPWLALSLIVSPSPIRVLSLLKTEVCT
jgi:hypothetical protein